MQGEERPVRRVCLKKKKWLKKENPAFYNTTIVKFRGVLNLVLAGIQWVYTSDNYFPLFSEQVLARNVSALPH